MLNGILLQMTSSDRCLLYGNLVPCTIFSGVISELCGWGPFPSSSSTLGTKTNSSPLSLSPSRPAGIVLMWIEHLLWVSPWAIGWDQGREKEHARRINKIKGLWSCLLPGSRPSRHLVVLGSPCGIRNDYGWCKHGVGVGVLSTVDIIPHPQNERIG